MTEQDRQLADTLKRAMPKIGAEPPFARMWNAAEQRADRRPRRSRLAAAAVIAAIGLMIFVNVTEPPEEALEYIEVAELLDSTSWSAPSDTLLPARRVDVYQEMPDLLESTDVYGGALL